MKKRYRIGLWLLIPPFLVFMYILCVGSYWFFKPVAGSGQFEEKSAAATARVGRLMQAPSGLVAQKGSAAPNPATQKSPTKPAPAGPGLLAEIGELDQMATGQGQDKYALNRLNLSVGGLNYVPIPMLLEEGFEKVPGTGRPQPCPAYRQWIMGKALAKLQVLHTAPPAPPKEKAVPTIIPAKADDPVPQAYLPALERTEKFLLADSWAIPEFKDYPNHLSLRQMPALASLAITRRAMLGEGEKAARLLERYLELLRLLHMGAFPEGNDTYTYRYTVSTLLATLGMVKGFPESGLVRAREILGRTHLDEKQMADFREAQARRLRDRFLEALQTDTVQTTHNAFDRMFAGIPGRLRYRLLKPLVVRQTNELSTVWAKGGRELDAAQLKFQLAFMAGGLDETPGLLEIRNYTKIPGKDQLERLHANQGLLATYDVKGAGWQDYQCKEFNDNVDLCRLVLAMARYQRAHGHYPEKVASLAPDFLEPDFAAALERAWVLYLPELGLGGKADQAPFKEDRVLCAFRNQETPWSIPEWKQYRVAYGPLLAEEEAILRKCVKAGVQAKNANPPVRTVDVQAYVLHPTSREELLSTFKSFK